MRNSLFIFVSISTEALLKHPTNKGGVVHTEILLPEHAPRDYFDRFTLWNAVEIIEKSCNSQLAREIELVLPKELTAEQIRKNVYSVLRQEQQLCRAQDMEL